MSGPSGNSLYKPDTWKSKYDIKTTAYQLGPVLQTNLEDFAVVDFGDFEQVHVAQQKRLLIVLAFDNLQVLAQIRR